MKVIESGKGCTLSVDENGFTKENDGNQERIDAQQAMAFLVARCGYSEEKAVDTIEFNASEFGITEEKTAELEPVKRAAKGMRIQFYDDKGGAWVSGVLVANVKGKITVKTDSGDRVVVAKADLFKFKGVVEPPQETVGDIIEEVVSQPEPENTDIESEDGEDTHGDTHLVFRKRDLYEHATGARTKILDNADPVAEFMRDFPIHKDEDNGSLLDLFDIAACILGKTGVTEIGKGAKKLDNITPSTLTNRYGHLNNGMVRMNLGNLMRGAIKQSEMDADTLLAECMKDT